MSMESFQRIDSRPVEELSPEEQQIRQMEEHAALLTRGKLLKHLGKKHKSPELAFRKFAKIANEISAIETGLHEHGVMATATWRYKKTTESNTKVLAGLVIGIFAAFIPGDVEIKVEYTTIHRLEPSTIRWYFWRKILLTFLHIVLILIGSFSLVWVAMGILFLLDRSSTQEEKLWSVIPLIVCPLCFFFAYKVKKSIIPPLLRIYGGNHFELISLKQTEPSAS